MMGGLMTFDKDNLSQSSSSEVNPNAPCTSSTSSSCPDTNTKSEQNGKILKYSREFLLSKKCSIIDDQLLSKLNLECDIYTKNGQNKIQLAKDALKLEKDNQVMNPHLKDFKEAMKYYIMGENDFESGACASADIDAKTTNKSKNEILKYSRDFLLSRKCSNSVTNDIQLLSKLNVSNFLTSPFTAAVYKKLKDMQCKRQYNNTTFHETGFIDEKKTVQNSSHFTVNTNVNSPPSGWNNQMKNQCCQCCGTHVANNCVHNSNHGSSILTYSPQRPSWNDCQVYNHQSCINDPSLFGVQSYPVSTHIPNDNFGPTTPTIVNLSQTLKATNSTSIFDIRNNSPPICTNNSFSSNILDRATIEKNISLSQVYDTAVKTIKTFTNENDQNNLNVSSLNYGEVECGNEINILFDQMYSEKLKAIEKKFENRFKNQEKRFSQQYAKKLSKETDKIRFEYEGTLKVANDVLLLKEGDLVQSKQQEDQIEYVEKELNQCLRKIDEGEQLNSYLKRKIEEMDNELKVLRMLLVEEKETMKKEFEEEMNVREMIHNEEREKDKTELAEMRNLNEVLVNEEREKISGEFIQFLEEELECSICNEILIEAVIINCAHAFCKHCIEGWSAHYERGDGFRAQNLNCPVCRAPYLTNQVKTFGIGRSLINKISSKLPAEIQERRRVIIGERAQARVNETF